MSTIDLPAKKTTVAPVYGEFSLSQARSIVGEHFKPNPLIFWTDFLLSMGIGLLCFWLVQKPELLVTDAAWHWPIRIGAYVASSMLFYRAVLFIHELMHIRDGEFTAFRFVWNMLCGIPFMVPTFVYYTHVDHHRRKLYGTEADGEYLPLASQSIWHLLFYFSQVLVIPFLGVIRFGILTPLTWINKPLRDLIHRRASSMVMNPAYIRPLPTPRVLKIIRLQEVLCFLWIIFIGVRMTTSFGLLFNEPLPVTFLLQFYLTAVLIITVNAVRTVGAHRWTNDGTEMTFIEQMVDSVNYPGKPLTGGVWAPVGLRFHALHHIFPTMPYHALATAHTRLAEKLPDDSPYHLCTAKSLTDELCSLWKKAKTS